MTRKDYILIAAAVKTAYEDAPQMTAAANVAATRLGIFIAANTLADALIETNELFDETRFINACFPEDATLEDVGTLERR